MNAKTTIVIPNWNGAGYLKDCLASLPEDLPVVVVDNGSTDESVAMVQEKFPQVKLIALTENTGFCKASNIGIAAADTPFVFLLNNDTKVESGAIEALEKAMGTADSIFSVQARLLSMKEPGIIDDAGDLYSALGWAFALGKGKEKSAYSKKQKVFACCGGAVLYRKDLFEDLGGFDENHFAYLEDIDLGYRALINGYCNMVEPAATVYHAGSASSGSRYNSFKVDLSSRNSIYLIGKNMPFLQVLINLPFLIPGFLVKQLFFLKKGFGLPYFRGICKGFSLLFSRKGREHKVRFSPDHFGNYLKIQWMLWVGTVRRLIG